MSQYVKLNSFLGDWKNGGHGRTVKCPKCGYQLTAYIHISSATCPLGHQMLLLTGHGQERRQSYRQATALAA